MKASIRTTVLSAAALFALPLAAQDKRPQVSPWSQVTQRIGINDVTVTYSRPGVKGRKIWGELVPYGKAWRTGANSATNIKFEDDVLFEGTPVSAGTYALFTIPGEKEWTVGLNKDAKQWGAYNHKPADDVASVKVTPRTAEGSVEWMDVRFDDLSVNGATLVIAWDKLRVPVKIQNKVNTNERVMAQLRQNIAKAKPGDWEPYTEAAGYALEQNVARDEAMGWVDKALAIKKTTFSHFVKGGLLNAAGKTKEGIVELENAVKAAGPDDAKPFLEEIKGMIAAWKKKVA